MSPHRIVMTGKVNFAFLSKILFVSRRFCGTFIAPTGIAIQNSPVTTCKTPFELSHLTGVTALNFGATTAQVGYSFTYRQIPGGC